MFSQLMAPLGYQQLTGTTVLVPTVPTGATAVLITVEGSGVRMRDDGTAPTALSGQPLLPASSGNLPLEYSGTVSNLQFIAQGATSVTVDLLFYRGVG